MTNNTVESPQEVLKQIFDQSIRYPDGMNHSFNPTFEEIEGLAKLLGENVREEELQIHLAKHPSFLCGMFGYHWSNEIAFLTKPRIGSKYVADFLIITQGQGGVVFHFVELEASHHKLLTGKGVISAPYNQAIKQIEDWDRWLKKNGSNYTQEVLKDCDDLPLYPETSQNLSFKLNDGSIFEMAQHWCDFDNPQISYTIIMGRWSKFSRQEKEKLMYDSSDKNFNVYTYEQLIRKSLARHYTPLP